MRMKRNAAGVSKLKVLIVLAILGIGVAEGIKVLEVFLDYERMKDSMNMKAGLAQVLKDDEIRAELVTKAKELDLPLTGDSFLIVRDMERRRMTIRTAWDEEVSYLWGLYVHTYHFEPVASENISSR